MERNLDRRVETLCPVRDRRLAAHIRATVLEAYLRDNDRASMLNDDRYRAGAVRRPVGPRQCAARAARVVHLEAARARSPARQRVASAWRLMQPCAVAPLAGERSRADRRARGAPQVDAVAALQHDPRAMRFAIAAMADVVRQAPQPRRLRQTSASTSATRRNRPESAAARRGDRLWSSNAPPLIREDALSACRWRVDPLAAV